MQIVAAIFAIAAGLAFLVRIFQTARVTPREVDWNAVGLFLLTVAWIVQTVVLSGTHWHIGP